MAVSTFGSNIVEAFTGGVPVTAIFMGSTQVWPTSSPDPSPEPSEYYIEWWPRSLSGTFTIGGETRWLQDYNGYYNGPFISGSFYDENNHVIRLPAIDSSAFKSTGILGVRTNVPFIETNAFMDCTSLAYVSMPGRYLRDGVFRGCTRLTDITLPELHILRLNVFNDCTNLRNVDLPNVTAVGWRSTGALGQGPAFLNCWNLQSVSIPNCTLVGGAMLGRGAFQDCGLPSIELPKTSFIGSYAFDGCSRFSCLTIGYSGVCTGLGLVGSSQNRVSIYVPLEWVSEYKSTYSGRAGQFYPIPYSNN